MTRRLQGLEAEGWVRRRRDHTDARVVRVTATARGRRVLQAGRRARIRRVEAVLKLLDARSLAHTAAAAAALEQALAELRLS